MQAINKKECRRRGSNPRRFRWNTFAQTGRKTTTAPSQQERTEIPTCLRSSFLYSENKVDTVRHLLVILCIKLIYFLLFTESNDALCTIPLNMLNEKFFIILWFLYWGLRVFLILGVLFRLALMFLPCFRFMYYALDLNIGYTTIGYLDKGREFIINVFHSMLRGF